VPAPAADPAAYRPAYSSLVRPGAAANSPLKNGLVAAQGRAAEFRRPEKAKEFVRLAETLFWPTGVEKAKDGFFNGLLSKVEVGGPQTRRGKDCEY